MPLTSHHSGLEQPGAELMVPIQRFIERQGRLALGVLAGVAVVAAIGYFTVRSRQAAEEAAAGKLAEASVLYWQGDYQRSLQLSRETAEQYASTPSGADAHRLAGDAAYWTGDFKSAIAEYRRYLDRTKSGLLADAAHRSLAYALESSQQFADAEKEYVALVGHFDRGSSAEFLLAAARCDRAIQQPDRAIQQLERLVNEFGETEVANQARIELAELRAARPATATP